MFSLHFYDVFLFSEIKLLSGHKYDSFIYLCVSFLILIIVSAFNKVVIDFLYVDLLVHQITWLPKLPSQNILSTHSISLMKYAMEKFSHAAFFFLKLPFLNHVSYK